MFCELTILKLRVFPLENEELYLDIKTHKYIEVTFFNNNKQNIICRQIWSMFLKIVLKYWNVFKTKKKELYEFNL